jgi:predicted  nucleic acid-binding Zn-ribbon protein
MFPDEFERLQKLVPHFQDRRETLACALLALEREVNSREEERRALEADIEQRASTLTSRLRELEARVASLEQQLCTPERTTSGRKRLKG